MKFSPSIVQPDKALADFLKGKVVKDSSSTKVDVYADWERPTSKVPDVFITAYLNGSPSAISAGVNYASGYACVSLYCKLNSNGTVNNTKVKAILKQFDKMIDRVVIGDYYFEYDTPQFITPTTPNNTTGYSVTTLNLSWHTINNFNSQ